LQLNNGIQLFARVLTQRTSSPREAGSTQISAPNIQIQPEISFGDNETDQRVLKAATLASRLPILIQGESGVGKEVAAQQIHRLSRVSSGPLISLNCASLPANLIESELFGYQPGAFTGANAKGQKGLIEQADGGTLFLDEIGDMPIELQTRLLRVLETKEITPLGSAQRKRVEFQLICATHVELQQAVTQGKFRNDLYYRIKGFRLQIKPMRERSDKLGLVQSLLAEVSQNHQPSRLSEPLAQFIVNHDWPGNIRELKNLLIQLDALSDASGVLDCTHLPDEYQSQCAEHSAKAQRSQFDRAGDQLIEETVARCQGNMSAAARELGVSRSTLYRRFKRIH
jgi:transcriptional regulator with PAS, ATPase and Fis domain